MQTDITLLQHGTWMEYPWNTYGTSMEHPGSIYRTPLNDTGISDGYVEHLLPMFI
jgi:hypothetical protein